MAKRRRPPFDPLASQPRSPTRRPGDIDAQADPEPDPNNEFIATHSLAGGGDPTWVIRFFRWLSRRRGR